MTCVRTGISLLLISSLFTSGCFLMGKTDISANSQAPLPVDYPLTTQRQMQAIHHWDLLALAIAEQVSARLNTGQTGMIRSIYVAPCGATTPFEKALRELLMTRLLDKGLNITDDPENHSILSFDVQVVSHGKRNIRAGIVDNESPAAGVITKRETPASRSTDPGSVPYESPESAEARLEAGEYTVELPKYELMITTSLTYDNSYLIRNTSTYYITDPEWWNYATEVRNRSVRRYSLADE